MNDNTTEFKAEKARPQCGTRAGYIAHYKRKEPYCEPCLVANREYQAEFRKKKHIPFEDRVAPTIRKSCGTPRGRDLHAYHGELACEPCRIAGNKRVVDYDAEHPEARHNRSRKWHLNNPELSKGSGKKWREANPEKVAAKNRRQRAKKRGAPSEGYTLEQILALYGTNCHLCGNPIDLEAPRKPPAIGWELGLHIDHVTPMSLGGTDMLDNVKPSHARCNLAKRASIAAQV